MGWSTGFPLAAYRRLLDEIAAIEARTLVPSASGVRHGPGYAAMNDWVYPLGEARFVRDLARRVPGARIVARATGKVLVADGGPVAVEPSPYVEVTAAPSPPAFAPHRRDLPWGSAGSAASLRPRLRRWLDRVLGPALSRASLQGRRLLLEVHYDDDCDHYAWSGGDEFVARYDGDYDLLNAIAAAPFADVIEGRRHWGEPLLGGQLRSVRRAYDVGTAGVTEAPIAPVFLYYGLSYEESHERWVEHQLAELSSPGPEARG
jgi:hypothetical protein